MSIFFNSMACQNVGITTLWKKKIKVIKGYSTSHMFWLCQIVKLNKILVLSFLLDPIESNLLLMTEIP